MPGIGLMNIFDDLIQRGVNDRIACHRTEARGMVQRLFIAATAVILEYGSSQIKRPVVI